MNVFIAWTIEVNFGLDAYTTKFKPQLFLDGIRFVLLSNTGGAENIILSIIYHTKLDNRLDQQKNTHLSND